MKTQPEPSARTTRAHRADPSAITPRTTHDPIVTRMPFVVGRLADPAFTKSALTDRFKETFTKIRKAKAGRMPMPVRTEEGLLDSSATDAWTDSVLPDWTTSQKIGRRAQRLVEKHREGTVGNELKEADLKKVIAVRLGVDMMQIPSDTAPMKSRRWSMRSFPGWPRRPT